MPSGKPAIFLASFFLLFGGIFLISQEGIRAHIAGFNPFESFDAPSAEALALDSEGYPEAPEGALALEEIKPSFFSRVVATVNGLRERLTAQVVGDIAPTTTTGFSFSAWPTVSMYPAIAKGAGSTYTFTLRAVDIYEVSVPISDITVLYTVDGVPVSPRISTAPYTFTWDSAGTPDGSHVVAFVVTEGANANKYKPEGNIVTVDNVPGVITGPQRLAVIGPGYLEARPRTPIPEWVNYSGGYTRQHNPGTTYPYRFSPPVHTLGVDPAPYRATNKWFVEPITSVETDLHDQIPGIYRNKAGHLGVGYYIDQIGNDVKSSKDKLLTHDNIDGPRNNNNVSPYTTYTPNPEGPGWVGIDAAGRIFKINTDGLVVTIAGRKTKRDVVPYYPTDTTVTEAERQALQIEFIGNFEGGIKFNGPTDLAFDPRNPKILYVADTYNFRIAKVDFTSGTPQITTYAGAPGLTGNVDGSALSARFKEPTSIAVAADGTVYVADLGNDNIRAIAPNGGAVTTLATSANQGLRDPFVVRLDSQGIIVLGELSTGDVKSVHPSTGATTLIKANVCPSSWIWLDVDRKGNLGPKDDIVHSCSSGKAHNNETRRLSRDGSVMTQYGFQSSWVLDFGRADLAGEPQLHYPWALAIDDEESRIIFTGFGNSAPHVYRLAVTSDPTPQHLYQQYMDGEKIFDAGTVPGFPSGDRTSFLVLRSSGGISHIPGIKSFDEMAVMSDDDLAAYIQGGMGGSVPRPEITGVHLKLLMHFIRLNSLRAVTESFSLPSVSYSSALRYYLASDTTKPVISNVKAELIDGATARVTWNTNESTIGFAAFGATTTYNRWSKIESGHSTTHSVILEHLPANTTVYYAVRSMDVSGNQTTTAPFTFMSGTPPGGVPPTAPPPATPPPAPPPSPTPTPTPPPPTSSIPTVLLGDTRAVKSGLWSDPTVWSTGAVPTGAQKVQIAGVTVEYDVAAHASAAAEAKSIVIADNGKLTFSRTKSTRLDLDGSLMVLTGGTLEVGTQASPIPAAVNAYIGLNVPNDRTFRTSTDPAPIAAEPDFRPEDVGIWVTGGGRMDINGAPKPKIWSKLVLTTGAGNSTATLVDTPTGWRVGDKVVVTPTGTNPNEVEIRTIASISGRTITFTTPLTYKHEAAYYAINESTGAVRSLAAGQLPGTGEKAVSIQGEVGLLTQNVTVASNQVTAADTNHRSHTFYLKNTAGSLSYAEFRDMGARAKLGRYPVHLHLTGSTVLNFPIIGLSIWNQYEPGNKWIVLHTTQKATVRGNVGYNAQGRGFYMETADEISNTMENNLGVRVTGPEEIPNTIPAVAELQQATRPGVFWVRAGNIVRGNVAVGGLDDVGGYWFTPSQLSDIPSTTFTNNEARANHFGFYFSGGTRMNYTVSNGLVVRNKVALWTDDLENPATISDSLLIENEGPGVRFANLVRNISITSLADVAPPTTGTIRDIRVTGDFVLVKTCTSTLTIGQTCTVSVVFKPTAPGLRTGTLSYFDAVAGLTKSIALQGFSVEGAVTPPPAPPPPAPPPSTTPPPPPPSPVPPPSGAGPIRIMAVGDSLTEFGFYQKTLATKLAGMAVSYDFVGTVKSGTPPNDYNNEGYSGKTVGILHGYLTNSPFTVRLHQPDAVLILLGTNDMTRPDNEIPGVVTQMNSLINLILSHEPDAFILLATIPENLNPTYQARVLVYNEGIKKLAADKKAAGVNIELVDVYTGSKGFISGDKTHPTAEGYVKIGETFFNSIAPLIASGKVKYHPLTVDGPATAEGLAQGLVAHYTFDTTDIQGTSVVDKSTQTNNATIFGNPTSVTGQRSQALSFDGVDDSVRALSTQSTLKTSVPFTLSAWIKLDTLAANSMIIGNRETLAHNGYWMSVESTGAVNLNYGSGGTCVSGSRRSKTTGAGKITTGQWYHVTGVVRGPADMTIFINGSDAGGSYSGTGGAIAYDSTSFLSIGRGLVGPSCTLTHADGAIDDVRVYNRALTTAEVQALHSGSVQSAVSTGARFSVVGALRSLVSLALTPFDRMLQLARSIIPFFDSKRATALVLDASATSINFGQVPVGQTSSEQVITFTLNDVTPPATAPTCSFSASPASVDDSGDSSTLTWSTQNASNVSISEGIGSVSTLGSRSVTVTSTKSFTLSATGAGGSVNCSTSVTIHNPQDDHSSHDSGGSSGGGGGGGSSGGRSRNRSTPSPAPSTITSTPVVISQRTFVRGSTSADMRTIQQILNRDAATRIASSGDGAPGFETGYFGAKTEDAIKRFQIKYGIVTSGTPGTTGFGALGPRTLAKIIEVGGGVPFTATPAPSFTPTPSFVPSVGGTLFTSRLSTGSTGSQVSLLQRYLATDATLYPEGLITGYYGPATQRAVERFQARFGIVSDGTPVTTGFGAVGPATQSRLNQIYGGLPLAPVPAPAPTSAPTPVPVPTPTPTPAPSVTAPAVSSGGVLFTRTLKLGDTGEDVSTLQKMLAKDPTIYPEGTVTGTFTAVTELAVRRFQRTYGIASSGDASTTGYGAVGPKTQAKLLQIFGRP